MRLSFFHAVDHRFCSCGCIASSGAEDRGGWYVYTHTHTQTNKQTRTHTHTHTQLHTHLHSHTYLLLAECDVRTASHGPSFFLPFDGPSAKRAGDENTEGKKRGSITCENDRANEDNKMFITGIWLRWLFRFWEGDRELEVCTATYGSGIDQSRHAKSVSHKINTIFVHQTPCFLYEIPFLLTAYCRYVYTQIHTYIHVYTD